MKSRSNRQVNRVKGVAVMLTALLCMLSLLTGCTTYNSFSNTFIDNGGSEEEPTITIGVFEPQTGRSAQKGNDELKGIELANSIYNNVNGYKVVLSKVDTKSSVSATETAIQGLIEMKPVAIIGSAGDATSLVASEYIDRAAIPTITPSSTNPLITQGTRYYFRASLTEAQMGQGLAEYAIRELDSDRIGVITNKNDSSTTAMLDGFEDEVKKLAGRKSNVIVGRAELTQGADDMEEALEKVRLNAINVCFVPIGNENMDQFFTLVEEKDMTDVVFLGLRSWGDSTFISIMEKHPKIKVVFPYESVLTSTDSTSDAVTEEAQRFQIEYANRYGVDDVPTYNAALGYDSYLLLMNAIHNAKSLEGKDIRLAMLELSDMKCSTGTFSFDSSGNVIRPVTLSTLKDGKPVTEYVTKSEAEFKELEDVTTQEEANKQEEEKKE